MVWKEYSENEELEARKNYEKYIDRSKIIEIKERFKFFKGTKLYIFNEKITLSSSDKKNSVTNSFMLDMQMFTLNNK